MPDTTDCSVCNRVLFHGIDDMGDDDESPVCERCQEDLWKLDQFRLDELDVIPRGLERIELAIDNLNRI